MNFQTIYNLKQKKYDQDSFLAYDHENKIVNIIDKTRVVEFTGTPKLTVMTNEEIQDYKERCLNEE